MTLRASDIVPALRTVGQAAMVGGAFSLTGMPLAWMIGAMIATATSSLAGVSVAVPKRAQHVVRALVGTMLGAAITPQLLTSFTQWWPSLIGLLLAMAIMFGAGYLVLRRWGGYAPPSAVLCAIPGGIAEMILLADKAGADETRVSIVHALRIALTILLMPLLLGAFGWDGSRAQAAGAGIAGSVGDWGWMLVCMVSGLLAQRLAFVPAPLVLVPMVVGGVLHLTGLTSFVMPDYLAVLVQFFIGITVGGRFAGTGLAALARASMMAVAVVAVQIATASGVALLAVAVVGWAPLAQLLAYAPGGLAEMSMIAVAVQTDPAFVGLHHMVRVLVALILAPVLLAHFTRRAAG